MKKLYEIIVASVISIGAISCSSNDGFQNFESQEVKVSDIFSMDELTFMSKEFGNHDIFHAEAIDFITSLPSTEATRSDRESSAIISSVILKRDFKTDGIDTLSLIPDTLIYILQKDNDYYFYAADYRVTTKFLGSINKEKYIKNSNSESIAYMKTCMMNYISNEIRNYEFTKDSMTNIIFQKLNAQKGNETRARQEKGHSWSPATHDVEIFYRDLSDWSVETCGPLLTVDWGQHYPFNEYIKNENGSKNAPTGCVSTAIAMVLAYWEYPQTIGSSTIDWNYLTRTKNVSTTDQYQCSIAATLMKEIGINIFTKYSDKGSSSNFTNACSFLESHGYDFYHYNYNFNSVKTSLIYQRPVIISGYNTNDEGHAWVIDGYKNMSRTKREYIWIRNKETGEEETFYGNQITEEMNSLHNCWGEVGMESWNAENVFSIDGKAENTFQRNNDIITYTRPKGL